MALRIKLRFRKVDNFISKFATNISTNGMFISSQKPRETGTLLRFELRLADDSTVIAGRGKVAWVRAYDPKRPKDPHGMGIEFTSLSEDSRELIAKIVAERIEQGLGDADGIPFAEPGLEKVSPSSAPGSTVPSPSVPGPSLGSAVPELLSIENLDTLPVNIAAAVARARSLVQADELDGDLEELFRVSAAPVAETVDRASDDLARMLGGNAIRARKRRRIVDPPTDVPEEAVVQEAVAQEEPVEREVMAANQRAITVEDPEVLEEFELPEAEQPLSAETFAAEGLVAEESQADDQFAPVETFVADGLVAVEIEADDHFAPAETIVADGLAAQERRAEELEADQSARTLAANQLVTTVLEADEQFEPAQTFVADQIVDELVAEEELVAEQLVSAEMVAAEQRSAAINLSDSHIEIEDSEPVRSQGLDVALASLDDLIIDDDDDDSIDLPVIEEDEDSHDVLLEEDDPSALATTLASEPSRISYPSGIDVAVLDAAGLEDNGIYELSKPGTGPIDLASLADLPPGEDLEDFDDLDSEIEVDLPDSPR